MPSISSATIPRSSATRPDPAIRLVSGWFRRLTKFRLAYGTQLIEMYWASFLRDVAFTDYASNSTAASAAAELGAQTDYRGPRDSSGNVTPDLLLRGTFPGEIMGPYMSQLMITPSSLGQQAMSQTLTTYLPGIDYMTDTTTFLQVQTGIGTALSNQPDRVPRYLHDGRGLAAYTHVDVLYEAYFVALLVLGTLKAPLKPGNPYIGSRTQNGFCTFGAPDFAAAIGTVATRALQRVWWQKWLVHLDSSSGSRRRRSAAELDH